MDDLSGENGLANYISKVKRNNWKGYTIKNFVAVANRLKAQRNPAGIEGSTKGDKDSAGSIWGAASMPLAGLAHCK